MEKETKDTNVKGGKKAIIIIVAVIVVIAIIIGVYFLVKNNNNGNAENNMNAANTTDNTSTEPIQSGSTEEIVDNSNGAALIDMDNTTNAEIVGGEKENTSSALKEEKTYKGMTVKDIKLSTASGITNFTATIENNSGTDFAGGAVTLRFINQDGSEYATLEGIIPEVANGKSTMLDTGTTADIANAYNFTIEESQQ